VAGDVRVGDLLEAAQDASVDLVLVDRVGERQSELRVGSRAAGAAVGDGGVARAAADAGLRIRLRAVRPVRAKELVRERRDRADLALQALGLESRDVSCEEVGHDVDLAGNEARDHRGRVAVPLEDEGIEVGRGAALEALVVVVPDEPKLLAGRDRLELEGTRGRDLGHIGRSEAGALDLVGHRDALQVVLGERRAETDVALVHVLEVLDD